MSRDLPSTSYAILGMLSLAPMSGYELVANVGKTIAHFWTISKSQAYTELARLESLGLVSGTDVSQEHAPDKRTYRLTPDGESQLDGWLAVPAYDETRTRSHFLLKVFFAHRMPPEVFNELLDRQRAEAERSRDHLSQIVGQLEGLPEAFFTQIAALMGVHAARANIAWIDEVRTMMPVPRREPLPERVIEEAARELFETTPQRPKRGRAT